MPTGSRTIGLLLRHALGLTAWKQAGASRWSLRANPSSGNLHPTEAYVIAGADAGFALRSAVYHYASDRHALEQRCAFDLELPPGEALVALTSIHWREAWKYGERAFRYCQHDLGHAIAAVGFAAALEGRRAVLLPEWSHREIAALTGIDRDGDYRDAEREEPGCLLAVFSRPSPVDDQSSVDSHRSIGGQRSFAGDDSAGDRRALVDAVRRGAWTGRASQLSEDHVQWTFIDEIARATEDPGRSTASTDPRAAGRRAPYPAGVLLTRRSALALDGRSALDGDRFMTMLARVMPDEGPPWDALWWSARVHLLLFVHRVSDVDPGLYLLLREPQSGQRLVAALGRAFSIEPVGGALPLVRLARGDCRRLAERVSCDQEIAADGFFSLGMIAELDRSLDELGPSFYRHLFWECGVVGQTLYLEAEFAGARGTGIGCFYDDPVHDVLGLTGHAFQSLYHFTIGMPVDDPRLTTDAGYWWESQEGRKVRKSGGEDVKK